MADADAFIPPAKGQSAPEVDLVQEETTSPVDYSSITQAGSIARQWQPDLDAIDAAVQRALALFPSVADAPPLVKDFESPVFWMSTVVPILLAVTAYLFHQDLSSLAVSLAAVGAATTTLGYTIYRGIYRHAHLNAVTTTKAVQTGAVRDAVALATTGQVTHYGS
jgi:hypothetical protein